MVKSKEHEYPTSEGFEEEEEEKMEEEEEEEEEEEKEEEPNEALSGREKLQSDARKLKNLIGRMSKERVSVRVHDVLIKGNTKTNDSVIEAEVETLLKSPVTMQELLQAASVANARLQSLDIFDSVSITLDSGPSELPDTANVIVEVVESKNPLTGDIGIFSKPESRSWSLEGSVKLKNLFGYGDIWDGSGAYGWDQTSEISAGLYLPRLKSLSTPFVARISLLTQDWLKFSSYKERLMGISVGFLSTLHHDLSYNLTWRILSDPSHQSSKSIRRQLGHSLLSSLKYTYKIDRRDSHIRPTTGYAFVSSSQIGGLGIDSKGLRFIRQEFDLRYALPLGFYNAALNFGISTGIILPWGKGFMSTPSPLPHRFFIGGHSSPVCSLTGPTTLLGFRFRGLGPTDSRRLVGDQSDDNNSTLSHGRDSIGGDFAVTAFADLSFNLPLRLFRESGIHGHLFISTGNLAKLSENEYEKFSFKKFRESFRSSAGFGAVVPTKLFEWRLITVIF